MPRPVPDRNAKLLEAGLALSSELSLASVLQRIIELAAEITGARYGALGVLGPDRQIAEFVTTGISEEERRAIGHVPVGRGILGVLIDSAKPLRLRSIADDPRSVGFPPHHPAMHSFLGAPVMARGRVFGNIYLTEKQGAAEFTAEDQEALVILASQAGVAVENARLYEAAHQRERRLEAIREIGVAILSGAALEEVLELVAVRARELMAAALATIAVPVDDHTLAVEVATGAHADELRGTLFPREGSGSGEVIRTGSPLLVTDAAADERVRQPFIGREDVGPAMFVPLAARGRAFGTLAVANEPGAAPFLPEDAALMATFADQAAVAIEYGRAQRELQRLTVMDERERIAKELHDGVIQSLFAVGMGLEAAASRSADPELGHRLSEAVAEIDRAIRDLRNYIFGLRPGILADRQLDGAIRQLAEEFESTSGGTAVVEVDPELAAELSGRATDVIQLVREALSNVGRHAHAATCRVRLVRTTEGALLEIDDDGRGFDVRAAEGVGNGLRNLRERAWSLGGDLEVASSPDEGTTIRVRIPE